jgi:branched-subunit amino acid transport protein
MEELAVLVMAMTTYATRLGGSALARYAQRVPRVLRILQHVSMGALVGIVVSSVVTSSDWPLRTAVCAAALIAIVTRRALLAMVAGAVVAAVGRSLPLIVGAS